MKCGVLDDREIARPVGSRRALGHGGARPPLGFGVAAGELGEREVLADLAAKLVDHHLELGVEPRREGGIADFRLEPAVTLFPFPACVLERDDHGGRC